MPVLHLTEVPQEVYDQLHRLAAEHHNTPEAEAVSLLHKQLLANPALRSQGELLAEMRRRSFVPPPGTPDSVTLLREDRER